MKPIVSPQTRQQVLALRQCHTMSEVAKQTQLPLGTVKTICARSGAFKDNPKLRELFRLPPIRQSASTALSVPALPPQEVVTGDEEIDAVLWLHQVIGTGQADLIDKAMEAAKRIKTPLKDLQQRYMNLLVSQRPGDWTVMFQTINFCDLDGLAQSSKQKRSRQHEALSRFGSVDTLFANTPAEQFCIDTLAELKFDPHDTKDEAKIDKRFAAHPDLMPHTLSDCLHELDYWNDLDSIRHATSANAGDPRREAYARERSIFRQLGRIRSKSKAEAVAVLNYLWESDSIDGDDEKAIFLNLAVSGFN
jgi:hypothetical protein